VNRFGKIVFVLAFFAAAFALNLPAETAVATPPVEGAVAHAATEAAPLVSQVAQTLFHIGPLPVSNSMVCTWIVAALIIVIVRLTTWKMKEVPTGGQNLMEALIEGWEGLMGNVLEPNTRPNGTLFPWHGPEPPRGKLFRNDLTVSKAGGAKLSFTDVTQQSGILATGYGMGAAVGDFHTAAEYQARSAQFNKEWDAEVSRIYGLEHGPPISQGEVIGAVNAASREQEFGDSIAQIVGAVQQHGMGFGKAQLYMLRHALAEHSCDLAGFQALAKFFD